MSVRRKGGGCSPILPTVLACLLVAVPGTAFAQGVGEHRSAASGTYRRPLGHDPQSLEPARISDVYSRSVAQQIFDGLVQFDQTLAIVPALAQFWKASRDGLTWTFTLRKGVKFHHGREVTADDVVFSFTRILDPRTRSGAADLFMGIKGAADFRAGRATRVAGLSALDPHTVQVVLTDAQVPFVALLAVGHAKILPRDVAEREGESFGLQPVGTGPFKFVRWERGKEIVLAANPDYFEGAPRLARVVYRIYPGEGWESAYDEFKKGSLEDAPLPTRNYRQVVQDKGHLYVKRPMISVRFYGLNTRIKPLDDRRVRQALVHAINREAIIEEAFQGRFTPARGVLPPGTQGYNPRLRSYAYDPHRARELLAEAGYPGGRGLPALTIWSSVTLEALSQEFDMVRRDLQALGIRLEVNYLTDWPQFSRMLDERRLPIFLYAWYADVPDPDNFLTKLFHSRGPRNFFAYANPVVDEWLQQAHGERDPSLRVEFYRKAEQQIVDDVPLIPFYHHTYERVFQPYVRSVEVNGLGDPYIPLRKIWLDRKD
jgi:oligopeptide transport system substrate-binding protein